MANEKRLHPPDVWVLQTVNYSRGQGYPNGRTPQEIVDELNLGKCFGRMRKLRKMGLIERVGKERKRLYTTEKGRLVLQSYELGRNRKIVVDHRGD